jgi:hypothetical protein
LLTAENILVFCSWKLEEITIPKPSELMGIGILNLHGISRTVYLTLGEHADGSMCLTRSRTGDTKRCHKSTLVELSSHSIAGKDWEEVPL